MSRVLIVTGGSRGLGAATCIEAAKEGYQSICVNYLSNKSRADQVVNDCIKAGAKAIAVQADVSKEADVVRLFSTVDEKLGKVTHLVNSAGIIGPYGRVDEINADELAPLWALNVTAMFICCREAIKRMSTKHGGTGGAIVNVSSASSHLGGPGVNVSYAASKGAVDSFNWGLAQEVAAEAIRVNSVSPGVIDTEIQPAGRVEKVGPILPMQRVGEAKEVAAAILFLLSEGASYIAGTKVNVSGAR
ncbi:MAG: SDR family oxidoreductase [Alphaproteobacteria bacterium]|jgi:NAD(P)-dependent dehydrogenase (short-subunit alcohol dehydrogenase family)|nr:SDR family oxidoreductase [Alphaproteobacteria bacterium]|tara:strand:- start:157 stop:894 length:738 start_codon:yes stop_codon:yes gene_type:complete